MKYWNATFLERLLQVQSTDLKIRKLDAQIQFYYQRSKEEDSELTRLKMEISEVDTNIESMENLRTNLAEQGYSLDKLPYVIQYNKRDMPSVATVEELRKLLNPTNVPEYEAIATTGDGVFDTLKAVAKLVLTELKRGGGGGAAGAGG